MYGHETNTVERINKDNVNEAFQYQPWNEEQVKAGAAIRESLVVAAKMILEFVPETPLRTRALNALIDARMLANAAITSPSYSYMASPQACPQYFNYTATLTGFSADPTDNVYQFTIQGRRVTYVIRQTTSGTSNATTLTATLPVTAKTLTNYREVAPCQLVDNGSIQTAPGMLLITSGSTTLATFLNFSQAALTNANGKRIGAATIQYDIA